MFHISMYSEDVNVALIADKIQMVEERDAMIIGNNDEMLELRGVSTWTKEVDGDIIRYYNPKGTVEVEIYA